MLNNKALQVPYGTRDVLPGEAGARRIIENKLASTFKAWGYDEVVTPTFEYLDTFAAAGRRRLPSGRSGRRGWRLRPPLRGSPR